MSLDLGYPHRENWELKWELKLTTLGIPKLI